MTESTKGIKNDSEKNRLELLSPLWLMGVGSVLTFGAKKYAAHNWRKGLEISRLLGACLRHVLAFLGGEDNDPETGLLHLYHASCCLMFASELYTTRRDLDDRYKPEPRCLDDIRKAAKIQEWGCLTPNHECKSLSSDGLIPCPTCERARIEFGGRS